MHAEATKPVSNGPSQWQKLVVMATTRDEVEAHFCDHDGVNLVTALNCSQHKI